MVVYGDGKGDTRYHLAISVGAKVRKRETLSRSRDHVERYVAGSVPLGVVTCRSQRLRRRKDVIIVFPSTRLAGNTLRASLSLDEKLKIL